MLEVIVNEKRRIERCGGVCWIVLDRLDQFGSLVRGFFWIVWFSSDGCIYG